ncbi:AAA ATPase afg3, partial [Oleoguttula sp. CCFEE 5521]
MTSILRRPQQLTRSSRQLVEAARLSQTLSKRPVSLPRPLYAHARSRQYATQPGNDGENKPSQPAKGMEHLYGKSTPMSNSPTPGGEQKPEGKDELFPGRSKLSVQEMKKLDEIFDTVKKGMPGSMGAEIDKALDGIKKNGIPTELRELVEETGREGMSPARAAKLWRLTTQMARQSVEERMKDESSQQAKQTTAE